jgi:hypothetical protein
MKRKNLRFGQGFRVAPGNARSQAAQMVLKPGNNSRALLKSLNFYVPPTYDREGDELPPGKP